MFPLIPTLVLSIFSLLSSVSIILRVLIPLIPPHPVSGRAITKRYSWSSKPSLSLPDKGHLWLALSDLLSLAIFLWEVFVENGLEDAMVGSDIAHNTLSSSRLWLVVILRQSCLLVILASALVRIRRAKPVSYGSKGWIIWVPVVLVSIVSTAITAVLASKGITSIFIGSICYSVTIGLLSTVAISSLFITLRSIHRNLSLYDGLASPKDDLREAIQEKKKRQSFATEDIEALKDGSSWITSESGSRHTSISSFSFDPTIHSLKDDRDYNAVNTSSPNESPVDSHNDSSWLTEPSQSPTTITDWSFPTSMRSSPRGCAAPDSRLQRHLSNGGVSNGNSRQKGQTGLPAPGEYASAYNPTIVDLNEDTLEKGLTSCPRSLPKGLDVHITSLFGWLAFIWLSLALSLPYLIMTSRTQAAAVLFILSTTLTAPILVINTMFCPLPIPSGLFELPSNLPRPSDLRDRYRRSGSITVVAGRLSTDIWMLKGDAVDRKSKLSRATSMLSRVPKLSVLPQQDSGDQSQLKIHSPIPEQDNSAATSAYVAIEADSLGNIERTFYARARYSSSVTSIGESLAAAIHAAERPNTTESISDMDEQISSARRASTSSRSSKGSKTYKEPFNTNLETIQDVSAGSIRLSSRTSSLATSEHSTDGPCGDILKDLDPVPPVSKESSRDTTMEDTSIEIPKDVYVPSSSLPQTQPRPTYEIDSLSACILPQLLPGVVIGPDIRVLTVPQRDRRVSSSTTFTSPVITSTPPLKAFGKRIANMRKRHGSTTSRMSESVTSQKSLETRLNAMEHRPFGLAPVPDESPVDGQGGHSHMPFGSPYRPGERKASHSISYRRKSPGVSSGSHGDQRSFTSLIAALETPGAPPADVSRLSQSDSNSGFKNRISQYSRSSDTSRRVSVLSSASRGPIAIGGDDITSDSIHLIEERPSSEGSVSYPGHAPTPARVRDTNVEYGTDSPSSQYSKHERVQSKTSLSHVVSPPESIPSSPSRKIKALFRRSSDAAVLSSQNHLYR